MRWRTQVEWQTQSGWRRGCQCWKGCWLCGGWFAPPTQEVGCVVVLGSDGISLCVFWCCPACAVLVALFVDIRVSQIFLENGCPWGTGWCCCGCVLAPPFWPSFQSIEMHTSGSSCHTPAVDMIEWEWLGIFFPHGCLSCGLRHLYSSTYLISLAS